MKGQIATDLIDLRLFSRAWLVSYPDMEASLPKGLRDGDPCWSQQTGHEYRKTLLVDPFMALRFKSSDFLPAYDLHTNPHYITVNYFSLTLSH